MVAAAGVAEAVRRLRMESAWEWELAWVSGLGWAAAAVRRNRTDLLTLNR